MKITRAGYANCWGARDELASAVLSRHSVIIGPNNVGKSSILECIDWFAEAFRNDGRAPLPEYAKTRIDYDKEVDGQAVLELDVELDQADLVAISIPVTRDHSAYGQLCRVAMGPHRFVAKQDRRDLVISHLAEDMNAIRRRVGDFALDDTHIWPLVMQLQNVCGAQCRRLVADRVRRITGWRSISPAMAKDIATWAGSGPENPSDFQRFERLNALVQTLCDRSDIKVRHHHEKKKVNMIWGNMFLPIDSYGDGISQVLLLAYHLVAGDRIVALIDEPELGLHPAAQRRLLGALCGASVEQFIATTHSPVFLDAFAGQSLVRVSQQDGVPQFSLPLLHSELSETLDDIGARPSDILQANVAIWVEGPSDRIFLLACLGLVAPDLKEGVHFQIVFYGGKVGTHLAFDDTPDGVNVLRMCRRAVIIMDSDCDSEGMEIAEWKQRIVEAVKQAGGWSWVTAGREIENYLHSDLLSHCYGEWWGMKVTVANSQWLRLHDTLCTVAMDSCPKSWWRYSDHKVEHMRRIASCLRDEHLDTLDLRVRVIELVEKIRGWN